MNCECEHERHAHPDGHFAPAIRIVKLIYGDYRLCDECFKNCYTIADYAPADMSVRNLIVTAAIKFDSVEVLKEVYNNLCDGNYGLARAQITEYLKRIGEWEE